MNNVTDINVNKEQAILTVEQHAEAWSLAVQANDYEAVIAALRLHDEQVMHGISLEAYIEMKAILHNRMSTAKRVAYTPSKGWYDAGEHGENIGAPVGD